MIQDALELLHGSETALVVKTDGSNMDLDAPDGKAFVAWWYLKESRTPDKVIIYLTEPNDKSTEVYVANYVSKERRPGDSKSKIYLADVKYAGETSTSWALFANYGKPIVSGARYLPA
jgi:hypothetical protein